MRKIFLLILFITLSYIEVVCADIVLDGSLGSRGALQGPNFVIEANMGQQYGGNLFHSFEQFDIKLNESASFSGPNSVNNIISRVTGGKTSTINGALESTIPNADFYLINPAGIIFGEGAKLNVQGSFYASSADYLRLGLNGKFNATHPQDSVLTVAPPSDFGFLESNSAPVTFNNSTLSVPDTKTLAITAGDIKLSNSNLYAASGTVSLTGNTIELENSTLGNNTRSPDGAANIVIRGEKFWAKNSVINAKTNKHNSSREISIVTTDSVTLQTDSFFSTDSFSDQDTGDIIVETKNFLIEDNAMISGNSYKNGAAAFISIKANNIVIKDQASIHADGNTGSVKITTNKLHMSDKTQITATDNVGKITIIADEIKMADDATINTMNPFNGKHNAGNIKIDANKLTMANRAWIISSSLNSGKSGSINIQVNYLNLSEESAISSMSFGKGNAGDITIRVHNTVSITEAAVVASGSTDNGNVGNIFLILPHDQMDVVEKVSSITEAQNVVTEEIAEILNLAKKGGKAGNLFIITDKLLSVKNGVIPLNDELQLTNCVLSNGKSAFIVEKREGLADAFKN